MAFLIPALIIAASTLAGEGISAWMSWKGMKKQAEATEEANRINLGLEKSNVALLKKWRAEDQELAKNRDNYTKIQNMMNGLVGQMNQNPQLSNNLVSLWRGRRA